MVINDTVAAALDPPAKGSGPAWHSDDAERNLCLKVTPTGARSWWFYGRVGGAPRRIQLGTFPEIDYDEAVRRCVRVRAALYDGEDPAAVMAKARSKRRAGTTLGQLWTLWIERYAKVRRKSWEADDKAFWRHCGELADIRVDMITPERLGDWHRALGKSAGEFTANKILNDIRAAYNRGMDWTGDDGRPIVVQNPAIRRRVPRFDEDSRDRYLDAEELRMFFAALADHDNPACRHFFQLALYTAARKSSLMAMDFADIDGFSWHWNIPRTSFKGQRRGHTVPVVAQAQEILNIRRELITGRWVFPGWRRGGNHLANVTYWWEELVRESQLEDVRIHDLRRTTASWMAMTGASESIIAQFLGHKRMGVTAIYARLDTTTVRDAAQRAVDAMLRAAAVLVGNDDAIVPHRTIKQAGEM